jgi:hypothetical protein
LQFLEDVFSQPFHSQICRANPFWKALLIFTEKNKKFKDSKVIIKITLGDIEKRYFRGNFFRHFQLLITLPILEIH